MIKTISYFIKSLFKDKYDVYTYRKKVQKFYGMCGFYYVEKVVWIPASGGLENAYERLITSNSMKVIESQGFEFVKKEVKYV